MAATGCFACLRFLVLSLNLVVLLAGLALAALGGWLVAEEHIYLGTAELSSLSSSSLALLCSGIAAIALAALGCCGALATSRCLLGTFSLLLVSLAFAQLSLAALVYFKQVDYGVVVEHMAEQTVQEKYQVNNTATVKYWDHVQRGLSCCGARGPEDWATSEFGRGRGSAREIGIGAGEEELPYGIPSSCCREEGSSNCSSRAAPGEVLGATWHTQGCSASLEGELGEHLMYILAAGAGVLTLELLGVSLSLCLCCTLARIEARKA